MPSTEQSPSSSEAARRSDAINLSSGDGTVRAVVVPGGGQVLEATVGNYHIVLAVDGPTAVVTDPRLESHNTYEEGEVRPGATWLSVDTSEARAQVGDFIARVVHAAWRQPWFRWAVSKLTPDSVTLTAEPDSRTERHLPIGQRYQVTRTVSTLSGAHGYSGSLRIGNTFRNDSDHAAVQPLTAEHWYTPTTARAAALNARGEPVSPEAIPRTAQQNGNKIDTIITSDFTGTPGVCVTLPDGPTGHVLVLEATITMPNGKVVPVNEWAVYRQLLSDHWTAYEPIMRGMVVERGLSVSLETTVRTFDSLADYYAYLAITAAQSA